MSWRLAGQRVAGVSELFSQMQMLITATQAVIAFVVGVAVMLSARAAAGAVRQTEQRDHETAHHERVGRVLAFTGAAVEVSAHGGVLATLQRTGLERKLPSPRTEEELRVIAWRDLIAASSAAARALQRLRFADDPSLAPAEELFGTLNEIVRLATEGDVAAVEAKVDMVGRRLRDFETLVKQPDTRGP